MPDASVLVVLDDEGIVVDVVRAVAQRQGFRLTVRGAGEPPARAAREEHATACLLRVDRHGDGELPRLVRDLPSRCQLLAATSRPVPDARARAVAAGAFAVLGLPVDGEELGRALEQVQAHLARRRSLFAAELAAAEHFGCAGMAGRGPAMQLLFERARRVAPWLQVALIVGEPGSGKRRFARALHALGGRRGAPLVMAERPAGDQRSLDALLFGAPGGANGADTPPGLVEMAEGGVLYIANVTHLADEGQRRLLDLIGRPADEASRTAAAGVVVIAGAEHHPRADVRVGRFRDDLLAALSATEFALPPLRERREDIAGLAAVLAHEAAAHAGRRVLGFTPAAERLVHEARWPGNVAELRATIERACLLAEGDVIGAREVSAALPPAASPAAALEDEDDLPLSSVEREHILRALQRAGGNKKAAARVLGVSRRALYRKLERLDLGATISRRPRERAASAARRLAAAAPPHLG